MKHLLKSVFPVVLLLSCIFMWSANRLHGQSVREKFDKLTISENFDSISSYWTTVANAENLFIVQDGEYILQRKSSTAPFAIIANFEEEFSNFRVVTSMKLDKSLSEEATVGFLFMMQPSGDGGFLCEINKKKEYRLRQIVNGSYKYITGSSKDGGWVRHSGLNEPNFSNMIEVRSFKRNYDLLFNGNFIMSFAEPTYKSGKLGLIIGPESRGKIDFMYVFTIVSPEETEAAIASENNPGSQAAAGPDIIELAESIIKLKTQINKLTEENEDMRKTISAMRSGDMERDVTVRNFEKQVKNLQDEIKRKEVSVDSLKKANTELQKFKELAGGNENSDLVITLSKALKAEKEKNALLEKENKELREKGIAPKSNTKSSKEPEPKSSTGFSLPVDN